MDNTRVTKFKCMAGKKHIFIQIKLYNKHQAVKCNTKCSATAIDKQCIDVNPYKVKNGIQKDGFLNRLKLDYDIKSPELIF